jgi:hypothetical protein
MLEGLYFNDFIYKFFIPLHALFYLLLLFVWNW